MAAIVAVVFAYTKSWMDLTLLAWLTMFRETGGTALAAAHTLPVTAYDVRD